MSFLKSPSVEKPKPLPSTPLSASFISRGGNDSFRRPPGMNRNTNPIIGGSKSRTGRPSLLGGTS